jgi:photosystem II stability/assembly factor-like uncharacterized protein
MSPSLSQPKHKLRVPRPKKGRVRLLVGTRKGAFVVGSDAAREEFDVLAAQGLGVIVHHVVADTRAPKKVLMTALDPEHGAHVRFSEDGGRTFQSSRKSPAFAEAASGLQQRRVHHVFWLTSGHPEQPDVWYAGTSPQGLFRSRDAGRTWRPVAGLNNHPLLDQWTGGNQDDTPDGPTLHSIRVDPRDAEHLYVALSSGGVLESHSAGRTWNPVNLGTLRSFEERDRPLQDMQQEFGQDPHLLVMADTNPDRLWQQGRTGVYRMDREEGQWQWVGANLPKRIGDVGFAILVHPRDPDAAWVFPLDGSRAWSRTAPKGQPGLYRTRDGGKKWSRQDRGLPRSHAYWSVKRQALAQDAHDPLGVYIGTSQGEIWGSFNEGRSWRCLARHLPEIYSLEVAGVTS